MAKPKTGPDKRRKARRALPDTASTDAGELSPLDFALLSLQETREAKAEAFKDGSWQAHAALSRLEREQHAQVVALRAEGTADDEDTRTDEQIVEEDILPWLGKLGLPLQFRIFEHLALSLQVDVPALEERSSA